MAGKLSSGGSTFTIANAIMPTMKQFPGVRWMKSYPAGGHTERPFGHSDSPPFALAPWSQGQADERRPARGGAHLACRVRPPRSRTGILACKNVAEFRSPGDRAGGGSRSCYVTAEAGRR